MTTAEEDCPVLITCNPVGVPGVLLADGAAASPTDRGHSLGSLHLPPAALPSLPIKGELLIKMPLGRAAFFLCRGEHRSSAQASPLGATRLGAASGSFLSTGDFLPVASSYGKCYNKQEITVKFLTYG